MKSYTQSILDAHQQLNSDPLYFHVNDFMFIDLIATCDESKWKRLDRALSFLLKELPLTAHPSNKKSLKTLLLSLSRCISEKKLLALAYPSTKTSIKKLSYDDNPLQITAQIEIVARALAEKGYVTRISGDGLPHKKNKVMKSQVYNRLLVTKKLLDEILLPYRIADLSLRISRKASYIRVAIAENEEKAKTVTYAPLVTFTSYEDKKILKESKKFLNEYNQLLVTSKITLSEGDLNRDCRLYVQRHFCRNCLQYGGRLYGGFWQQIPSGKKGEQASRKNILINSEPTVELDFQALHINMLYVWAGEEPLNEDPYANIEGYDRALIKACLLVALNARTKSARPVLNFLKSKPDLKKYYAGMLDGGYAKLLEAFFAKHPKLKPYLHADVGVKLQRQDSDIAMHIMRNMMYLPDFIAPKPVLTLCVHDSFICPAQHEETLRSCMAGAFERVMGTKTAPIIK